MFSRYRLTESARYIKNPKRSRVNFLINSFCKSIDLRHFLDDRAPTPHKTTIYIPICHLHARGQYTCQPLIYIHIGRIHTCQPYTYISAIDIHVSHIHTYMPAFVIHARPHYAWYVRNPKRSRVIFLINSFCKSIDLRHFSGDRAPPPTRRQYTYQSPIYIPISHIHAIH